MPTHPGTSAPSPHRLTLLTLGNAELRASAPGTPGTLLLLPAGKPLALLTYLACTPGHTASREHLIDLLWSDRERDAGRHALRQTLWYIRQKVGVPLVSPRGSALELAAALDCDRTRFLHAAEQRELEHAVALYRGDFLPSFAVPGGAEFELWADGERQRLRSAFVRCGELLVRRHLEIGHAREAILLARRMRDVDPLAESGWRLLLEAMVSGADCLGAAAEAERLEALLREEEREPDRATAALLRLARAAPERHATGTDERQPLVAELTGREQEFSAVIRTWDAVTTGAGARHIHVEARAGIGKSRLLADVRARLRATRARVVPARAHQGARLVGYGFVSDVAAALAALPGARSVSPASAQSLVALNPSISSHLSATADPSSGDEARRRRTVALQELVAAVSAERPLALLLDDLHWADALSLALLRDTLERLTAEPVLTVTTARPTHDTIGNRQTLQLKLLPLDVGGVASFVESIAALPDTRWAHALPDALLDATQGSPLLLLETLQHLVERELLALAPPGWATADPDRLLSTLRETRALEARIASLPGDERHLLLRLALAGVPLSGSTLRLLSGQREGALATLERRGLAAEYPDGWSTAHDEIAATVAHDATPEECLVAQAELGATLAATDVLDDGTVARATRHLQAGRRRDAAAGLLARWLVRQRQAGERRPDGALLAELLGQADPALLVEVRRRMPARWRPVMRRVAAAAAAFIGLGAILGTFSLAKQREEPEAEVLLRIASTADGEQTVRLRLNSSLLHAAETVDLDDHAESAELRADVRGSYSPDGTTLGYHRSSPDSGDLDIYVVRDGTERRITHTRHDDYFGSWSPDGRLMAISSGRWDHHRLARVGVLDPTNGWTRELSERPGLHHLPRWSPDGSRIGYVWEDTPNGGMPSVCWTAIDRSASACRTISGAERLQFLEWAGPQHALVVAETHGDARLLRVNIDDGRQQLIADYDGTYAASTDGHWILCDCRAAPGDIRALRVFRIERPDRAPLVTARGAPVRLLGSAWRTTGARTPWIERLRITEPESTIRVDVSHKVRMRGTDASGRPTHVPFVAWSVSDTSIATITPGGILQPRRQGRVRVRASAGGWRADSLWFTVASSPTRVILTEDWRAPFEERFVSFGDPPPQRSTGPDGVKAMWVAGDGNYMTGAYSRERYPSRAGLGVDAMVSMPVARINWQILSIGFTASFDADIVRRWDHRTGAPPQVIAGPELLQACVGSYPAGEGPRALRHVAVGSHDESIHTPFDTALADGRWVRLRVQLFPDGRCGLAVNGRAVARTSTELALRDAYRIHVIGNSYDTRMLVGPLDVWSGVRGDVDWSVLDQKHP